MGQEESSCRAYCCCRQYGCCCSIGSSCTVSVPFLAFSTLAAASIAVADLAALSLSAASQRQRGGLLPHLHKSLAFDSVFSNIHSFCLFSGAFVFRCKFCCARIFLSPLARLGSVLRVLVVLLPRLVVTSSLWLHQQIYFILQPASSSHFRSTLLSLMWLLDSVCSVGAGIHLNPVSRVPHTKGDATSGHCPDETQGDNITDNRQKTLNTNARGGQTLKAVGGI